MTTNLRRHPVTPQPQIASPYAMAKCTGGTYAVVYRYLLNGKIQFKTVFTGASRNDASLISSMLNDNWRNKQ